MTRWHLNFANNHRFQAWLFEMLRCLRNRFLTFSIFLASALALSSLPKTAVARDWLAVEPSAISGEKDFFSDDVFESASVTQNIRIMMRHEVSDTANALIGAMITDHEVDAGQWIKAMPAAQPVSMRKSQYKVECQLENISSRVVCDDVSKISMSTGTSTVRSTIQPSSEISSDKSVKSIQKDMDPTSIVLTPRPNGLVTVAGELIIFDGAQQTKTVMLDDSLADLDVSLFVRDPSIVFWDEVNGQLVGKKNGHTEVFVVTPGRISIIDAKVGDGKLRDENAAIMATNLAEQSQVKTTKVAVPQNLSMLDGLDQAAAPGRVLASHGDSSSQELHEETAQALREKLPENLIVGDEVTKIGVDAVASNTQFLRAKEQANFETIRLKVVDDRSLPDGRQFPIGGVRVKIAGTEFNDLTNSQGEIEIRDVPQGARLLVELGDERGYIMPQIFELVADREGVARRFVQTIVARRFVSLDIAARSIGVSQDVDKSTLCAKVTKNRGTLAGVSVSLDTKAIGPIYFNNMGLADLRLQGTASSGVFCFFNVEPGPVAIGFNVANEQGQSFHLASVAGLVPGRHFEDTFDLGDARYVTTTLSTIATANEQLGTNIERAARHDLVESADVYAVGSGQMMVPVDDGLVSTPTTVLPFKDRVWTVSASSDFETSVQALPVKAPSSRQITTLIPNGFVNDMSVFAQTPHNSDQGSVMVEHGNLGGHSSDGIKMKLVDGFGRDVGNGWYFADNPVSKAIFFNVPAGQYALVVETATGHWIAADTVMVYSESVSVARTGSHLEKKSMSSQHASIQ